MKSEPELRQTELHLSVADFIDCEWRSPLAATERDGYSSMQDAFLAAARQAFENEKKKNAKIFWLLSAACSMMLRPQSTNEPFRPLFIIEGQRSIIADDFEKQELSFFSEIVWHVDDQWLRARLADIVWITSDVRDVRFALAAIDAYHLVPLDLESWIRGGEHCWSRAIVLCKLLKNGAGDRLIEIENKAIAVLDRSGIADGFLALWLAEMLASYVLGRSHRPQIASKLETLALAFRDANDSLRARGYFKGASDWYRIANDDGKSANMFVELAESFASEALSKVFSNAPANILATSLYEDAIQAYRQIPRNLRAARCVDERIVELRALLKESGEQATGEFSRIETSGVNVSDVVHYARAAVMGKSLMQALRAFVSLHSGANASTLRKQVLEGFNTYIMSRMFGSTMFSSDGRVVAKRPAFGNGNEAADEQAILTHMIRDHGMSMSIVVQGCVLPALDVLRCEHRVKERDFVDLAALSPIVPPDRQILIGKALFAGYEHDFVTALHLLVPQIEHLVRHRLQRAGVITAKLDADGIETEVGLSALMDIPEANNVFGEDIAFEFRALFCDACGPNLRNRVAHGLLDDRECNSVYTVYAWWLTLRLVFNSYWAAREKAGGSEQQSSPSKSAHPSQ